MQTIGLVGIGYWGWNYIRVFTEVPGCQLKWVADLRDDRLDDVERRYPNIETTTDYVDILDDHDIDAVCVATPPSTHFNLASEFLKAGKDLLVEKPFTLDSDRAWELKQLADREERVILVGHVFEYNNAVKYIREQVEAGELGTLYNATSQRTGLGPIRQEVSALWDLAPHDISMLMYLLNTEISSVRCFGQSYLQDVEDFVFLFLEFENGVSGFVYCSWLHPRKIRETNLVGDNKMIVFNDTDPREVVQEYDNEISREQPEGLSEFQYTVRSGDVRLPDIDLKEPLKTQVEHFIKCIETRETPLTGPAEGAKVVEVLEAAEKSMSDKGTSYYEVR